MRASVLLVLLLAGGARADNLRCGERLVNVDDTASEVAAKCGPPTSAERRVESRRTRAGRLSAVIDTWVYDFGPSSFIRVLTFTNGTLDRLEVGDYGKKN